MTDSCHPEPVEESRSAIEGSKKSKYEILRLYINKQNELRNVHWYDK